MLSVVLAASLVAVVAPVASPASAADPLRVLIVGDSVTQGSSGDWTWRYRLWQHLVATSGQPVEFVGPRDDLHDYLTDDNGNHEYVDPGFDQDHAARWGMSLTMADIPIDELVATHQPDVVVEMLGTNDLLFFERTPDQVEQDIVNFVAAARSADPDVDVVLSEITQTWFEGAPEFNALLAQGADELDTVDSRVLLAEADNGYTSQAHTFDNSHPNAQGEVLIAAAVADQLAVLGIGTPPGPLPTVPLGPRIPAALSGSVTGRTADLSWTRSPGAASVQLSVRDATAGSGWTVVEERATGTTWAHHGLPVGHTMQFRVLPRKGWLLAQPDVATIVSLRAPRPPGRTRRVEVVSRASGRAVITWRAARRADDYTVEMRRVGRGGWRTVAADWRRTRLVRRGLPPGATFVVRVTAANPTGEGPTSDRVRFSVPRR